MENKDSNISRRSFIAAGAALALATELRAAAPADTVRKTKLPGFKPLDLRRLQIKVGAERPFKAVHISDTHIVRADATEKDPRKLDLASRRYTHMAFGEHYLAEAVAAARRDNALLLHTGDMIDFVSNANLRLVARYFGSDDWFVSPGNHEFSKYVGEAREDAAYKADSYARVSASFPNDLTFASRVVNGVNFVAVDDVYYNRGLARPPRAAARGRPDEGVRQVPQGTAAPQGDPLRTLPRLLAGAVLADRRAVRLLRDLHGRRIRDRLYLKRRKAASR